MLSSSLYLFVSKVCGYGIRIILPVFLVRILTKEEFGLYSQFFLIEVMIKIVFQMGVNQSLFFFIPRDRENAGAYFLNSLLLNVVIYSGAYVLVWLLRDTIARELGLPVLLAFFWHLAGYTLLMMLNTSCEAYLTARQHIVQSAVYSVLREVLASIATLYAAFTYRDLSAVFLALVVSRGVSLLLGLAYVHLRLHGFRSQSYFFRIGEQVRYGIVLGLAGMVWTLLLRVHELTVTRYFDPETYAVYAAGCRQIPVLQFFGQSLYVVALTQFAQMEKRGDWDGIKRLWDRVLASMFGVGVPVGLLLLLVAEPLVTLMFTSEYAGAVPVFRLNTIAHMSFMLNPTLVLRAMDRNDLTLRAHLGALVAAPFLLYSGMKLAGTTGIIAAHAVLLNGGRLATLLCLNAVAPRRLAAVPSPADVAAFYGDVWRKARGLGSRRPTR